jgi:hypothetical protein
MLRLAAMTAGIAFFALALLKPIERHVISRYRRDDGPPSQIPPG